MAKLTEIKKEGIFVVSRQHIIEIEEKRKKEKGRKRKKLFFHKKGKVILLIFI